MYLLMNLPCPCLPTLNLFFNLLMPVVTAFCMEPELVDGPEFSAPGPDIFCDIYKYGVKK